MRFVFAKSRLRTRYKSLFLVFSGKLHDAIMSGQVSLTVENVFMENNIFQECVFGRWRWGWCFWKSFGICFASHDVFARQQQLPNCTLFQQVLHVNVLNMVEMVFVENVYFSGLAFCNVTGRCICNMCKCMSLGCFCFSWNLGYDTLEVKCMLHALNGSSMLHDRIKEKQRQHCTVADRARTSYLCLFCVLREKGESEVKWEFVGFWLACVCKFIHRHRRLGSDPNA